MSIFIKHKAAQFIPFIVAVLGLTPAIAWTLKEHPNQYVYFNEFVGGIAGANGYYDTDYYQNTGLQSADWIIKNAKKTPGKKILVASNMLGFDKYFAKDTSWISWYYVRYNDRHQKDWDYYVTYSRYVSAEQLQNGKWPPANAAYNVKAGRVVIGTVLERKNKAGIEAFAALQQKDFAKAAMLYAECTKADPTDENALANYAIALASTGNLDGAAQAMNQAVAIDAGRADFYQMLAQIYQAKGDQANAQQAMNNANAIMMREQENME